MRSLRLGVLREGKNPPDRRVPLTPDHCRELRKAYPRLEIVVQSSAVRSFSDEEYRAAGIPVRESISDCDVLMGVKEVPVADLVAGKTYFFFSHTIKEQPYNRVLLKTILERKIQLVDYECLVDGAGKRLIGFGRYAGIVGAYNGIIGFGKRTRLFDPKRAHECRDRAELERELAAIELPAMKIVLTGMGRVAKGAREIMAALGVRSVPPEAFLREDFDHPVFCQLGVAGYNRHRDGVEKGAAHFYRYPEEYESGFLPYAATSDLFISCHYWDPRSPRLFEKKDLEKREFRLRVIADITCDIDGSVPTTTAPSTIQDPFYGYNRHTHRKDRPFGEGTITVMAVDNLPCELPRDASEEFGKDLMRDVLPHLVEGDREGLLHAASITRNGTLTEKYRSLGAYVNSR